MQNIFEKINLPHALALQNLLNNDFLGRSIAKNGYLSFETLSSFLIVNENILESQLNVKILETEIRKMKNFEVDDTFTFITNPLWAEIPTDIIISPLSFEEHVQLKSSFTTCLANIRDIKYLPNQVGTSISLILNDLVKTNCERIKEALNLHLTSVYAKIEVQKAPFSKIYTKLYYERQAIQKNNFGMFLNRKPCFPFFHDKEFTDIGTILKVFSQMKDNIKPNPGLEELSEKKCPILCLYAIPELEMLKVKKLRKFSSTLHDREIEKESLNCKGNFQRTVFLKASRKGSNIPSNSPDHF